MLTFKDVEPCLHKWAFYFSNNRFDYWELINAVWENGKVQALKDKRLASNRVRLDMIDYMRRIDRIRQRRLADKRGRVYPRKYNVSDMISDETDYEYNDTEDILFNVEDNTSLLVDRRDLFDFITSRFCNDRRETLAFKLRFIDEMSLRDIGRVLELSCPRVSQVLSNIMVRVKSEIARNETLLESIAC